MSKNIKITICIASISGVIILGSVVLIFHKNFATDFGLIESSYSHPDSGIQRADQMELTYLLI